MDSYTDRSHKGYNPLRWDCEKNGCFNLKRRPKIEVFSGCFPGRINFGDVDGIVEINGKGLMLEWKTGKGNLPLGQSIMYQKLTISSLITVICIVGNAETMECQKYCLFFEGKQYPYKNCSLNSIIGIIKRWVKWANTNKATKTI